MASVPKMGKRCLAVVVAVKVVIKLVNEFAIKQDSFKFRVVAASMGTQQAYFIVTVEPAEFKAFAIKAIVIGKQTHQHQVVVNGSNRSGMGTD